MSFGENLQALRRQHGLTQEAFAAQLKVSRQAVSKWESCKGYPEIEKILYICNRYGVTLNDLFEEEVPLPRQTEAEPAPPAEEGTAELPVRPLRRLLEGRDFVTPEDVQKMAEPVLAHRLVLSPEARMRNMTAERILANVMGSVQVPVKVK